MKRVFSFFCLCVLLFFASSTEGSSYPVNAMDKVALGSVDVIIQTDGATQILINQISSLGGTINYAYQNVPALAVTLPVKALRIVHTNPNVIRVAKDHPVTLLDGPALEGSASARNFHVLDAAGFIVSSLDLSSLKSNFSTQGYGGFLISGRDATNYYFLFQWSS